MDSIASPSPVDFSGDESAPVLPGLSVIMPCFNAGAYLQSAVSSVLQQSYGGPVQFVVVDDASTDDSYEIVKRIFSEYTGPFETLLLRNEMNMGVAVTVDVALQHVRYDWVVETDADDIQELDRLQITADAIARHPEVCMVTFSAVNVDEKGIPYGKWAYCEGVYDSVPDELLLRTPAERLSNYLATGSTPRISTFGSCMAFRYSVLKQWGVIAPGHERAAQDSPLELRAFLSGPVFGSRRLACRYRSHSGNLLNKSRKWDTLEDWKENERFWSRYHLFNKTTRELMLADVQRAMRCRGMSDWTAEQLQAVEQWVTALRYTSVMAAEWWHMNCLSRLLRFLLYRKKVTMNMRPWFRNRLLPFHLACWVRFKLHRRRG